MKKYRDNEIIVPRFNEENGFYTTKQRSDLMSKIKAQNTKSELKLRKALWSFGFRYRKNVKNMPGCPDIVFTRQKLLIFVDGEFWHGFNWQIKRARIKTNRDFWIPKIERNMQRDRHNNELLTDQGWIVMRFWEQELKKNFETCVNRVVRHLENYQNTI